MVSIDNQIKALALLTPAAPQAKPETLFLIPNFCLTNNDLFITSLTIV